MSKISSIILVGGKSSRMGKDKASLEWEGKSFVEHIRSVCRSFSEEVLLVGTNEVYGKEVVHDKYEEIGPIGGIVTGLEQISSERAFVLSCDVPLINQELLDYLLTNHERTITIFNGHPLIGVYEKDCLVLLRHQITKGALRLQDLPAKRIECPNHLKKCLSNINTPEDMLNLKDGN